MHTLDLLKAPHGLMAKNADSWQILKTFFIFLFMQNIIYGDFNSWDTTE